MSVSEILNVFEAKAIEKYGSVFQMSKKSKIHYNILMRYRNKPGDVRLSTLIKIFEKLDLKIEVSLN